MKGCRFLYLLSILAYLTSLSKVPFQRSSFIPTRFFSQQPSSSNDQFSTEQMEKATRLWIERVVIGHNLCPWAAGIHTTGKLKFLVAESRNKNIKLSYRKKILKEAKALITPYESDENGTTPIERYESTVIILPYSLDDFSDYLDFISIVEEDLNRAGLTDYVQVATFHPQFRFDQTQPTDPENYTNRSPFPIAHLLRENDVTQAVDSFDGQTDVIWNQNIETMRTLGLSLVEGKLKDIIHDVSENDNS